MDKRVQPKPVDANTHGTRTSMSIGTIVGAVLLLLFLTSLGVWLYGESQGPTDRATAAACARIAAKAATAIIAVTSGALALSVVRHLLSLQREEDQVTDVQHWRGNRPDAE